LIGYELLSTFATPWKGENLRAKKTQVLSTKAAHGLAALCAAIGEAKRRKVTGSRMNAETLMVKCFPFIGLLDKHARMY
jgi:hypothetical protein